MSIAMPGGFAQQAEKAVLKDVKQGGLEEETGTELYVDRNEAISPTMGRRIAGAKMMPRSGVWPAPAIARSS